jgi:hypothetical protein
MGKPNLQSDIEDERNQSQAKGSEVSLKKISSHLREEGTLPHSIKGGRRTIESKRSVCHLVTGIESNNYIDK